MQTITGGFDKKNSSYRLFGIVLLILFLSTGCLNISRTSPGENPDPRKTTVSDPVSSGKVTGTPSFEKFKIFLIALEDNGKSGLAIGCLDSLVAVDVEALDSRAALEYLLSQRSEYYGQSGLYNPLYRSRLKIVQFVEKGDGVQVELEGDLSLGGMCDNPRISGQMTSTILQTNESTRPVIIRINGALLDDLLSLQ